MERETPNNMKMNPKSSPIIENEGLPTMDDMSQPGANIMGDIAETDSRMLMSEPTPADETQADDEYPDMEPKSSEAPNTATFAIGDAVGAFDEGYLRLLVSVEKGSMQVVDAEMVSGPLVEGDLSGLLAYQAVVDQRRVAAGAFSDLSVQHSYAPPDEEQTGHRVVNTERYEFMVRIPRAEITLDELPNLEIELVRPANTTSLSKQADLAHGVTFIQAAAASGEPEPEVIARIEGVQLDQLPEKARNSLKNGLR